MFVLYSPCRTEVLILSTNQQTAVCPAPPFRCRISVLGTAREGWPKNRTVRISYFDTIHNFFQLKCKIITYCTVPNWIVLLNWNAAMYDFGAMAQEVEHFFCSSEGRPLIPFSSSLHTKVSFGKILDPCFISVWEWVWVSDGLCKSNLPASCFGDFLSWSF